MQDVDTMAQLLLHLGSSSSPAPESEKAPRLSTSTSKLAISFLVDSPAAAEDSSSAKRKRHTDVLCDSRVKLEPDVERPQLPRPAKRARPQSSRDSAWSDAAASGSSARSIIPRPVTLPTSLPPSPTPFPASAPHHPAMYQASALFPPTPYFVMTNPQLLSSIHQQLLLAQTAQAYLLHQASQHHHQQQQQPQRPLPLYPQTAPVYLGPSTPPGLSSASSPPSSPALSSSPSSPLNATSTPSRTSNESPSPGCPLGDRNFPPNPPVGDNNSHDNNIDVQQHTQQLLKQWHRQRQVQKMLYLQQKKHKKQQQRPDVLAPVRATTTTSTTIPPVPTFTSAAVGQPSSLSAETLMALIDELLRRHVGTDAPRPCADKEQKEQPAGSKRRHRVPPEHLQVLEEVFAAEPFPHAEAKNELALRLGMTKRSITIWFQNKRARLKRNDEEMSPSSSSSRSRASTASKSDTGIVFHQLTVDTSGQLAIIPEFPLQV